MLIEESQTVIVVNVEIWESNSWICTLNVLFDEMQFVISWTILFTMQTQQLLSMYLPDDHSVWLAVSYHDYLFEIEFIFYDLILHFDLICKFNLFNLPNCELKHSLTNDLWKSLWSNTVNLWFCQPFIDDKNSGCKNRS